MDLKEIYKKHGAFLQGHFLLSSGNHSEFYLQSAKVLESPQEAEILLKELANKIKESNLEIDTICSPAIGGLLAGYELARALNLRFIFTERKNGKMSLRRGFEVSQGEKILICEDIITTGGSAVESASEVEKLGAEIVGFSALANRGFCKRVDSNLNRKKECKLPKNLPFFALDDFVFEIYSPHQCPLCKKGSQVVKAGSRGNF